MSWSGRGDYSIRSNSLVRYGGAAMPQDANIQPAGPRSIRIRYKEYLGDVVSSATPGQFSLQSFLIQPGLLSTFPWLAPIAQQYEQWIPNGIFFEFRSTSSEFGGAGNQALGSVIMATEYDIFDVNFLNKQEMLNSAFSNEQKSSCQRILHGIECARGDTPNHIFYLRAGAYPAGSDKREYDLCNFQIATQGVPTASQNLGSLYIHYDITFKKEIMFNGLIGGGLLYDYFTLNGTIAPATPLGSVAATLNAGSMGGTAGNLSYTFPSYINQGTFEFLVVLAGTAQTNTQPPAVGILNNCQLAVTGSAVSENGQTLNSTFTAASTPFMSYSWFVRVTGANAVFNLSGASGLYPTAATSAKLTVKQTNQNVWF